MIPNGVSLKKDLRRRERAGLVSIICKLYITRAKLRLPRGKNAIINFIPILASAGSVNRKIGFASRSRSSVRTYREVPLPSFPRIMRNCNPN